MKSRFLSTLFFVAAVSISSHAGAVLLRAEATLYWDTFSWKGIDTGNGTPSITWFDQEQSANTQLYPHTDDHFASSRDWTSEFALSSSRPPQDGSAWLNASQIRSVINDDNSSDCGVSPGTLCGVSAGAGRRGKFMVTGTGRIEFQVDYSFFVQDDPDTSQRTVRGGVSLILFNNNRPAFSEDRIQVEPSLFPYDPDNTTGTITVAVDYLDGERGSIIAGAGVGTAPIPATAWLFSSGLIGLVGVARRKKV